MDPGKDLEGDEIGNDRLSKNIPREKKPANCKTNVLPRYRQQRLRE